MTDKPIRVDQVDLDLVPGLRDVAGRLGMTLLPGKNGPGFFQDYDRDLPTDAATLREFGVTDLVVLVEDHELQQFQVTDIIEVMASNGIDVIRYPIVDVSIPTDLVSFASLIDRIEALIRDGHFVTVVCRGGLGRTGTVVGCLLRQNGLDGEAAIVLTRDSRHDTIETDAQALFVESWASPAVSR